MQPILAIDFGTLFAVGFLLISFIGWIMNLINSQNPPPQPNRQARRPRQRDPKMQSDIEAFLQEAVGRRGPQQKKESSDGIEILEQEPTRRRAPAGRPQQPKPATARPRTETGASQSPPKVHPGESLSSRHVATSSTLGTGGQSHIKERMEERIGDEVKTHLPHRVEQSIASHLGEFRADDRRTGVAPLVQSGVLVNDPAALLSDLRQPAGIRKAIVLQEILSKPRGLRNG